MNGKPSRRFFLSSRRRHTRFDCDWSSDVCSSDLCSRRGRASPSRRSRTAPSIGRVDGARSPGSRSEEHTSELQSQSNLVCRLLLEKKKKTLQHHDHEHDNLDPTLTRTHQLSKSVL